MALELHVEQHFVKRVKQAGGVSVKLEPRGTTGWPDRLAFLPGGKLLLVELKRPKGGRVSRKQSAIHKMLRLLGFDPYFAHTKETVDLIFKHLGDPR